MGDVVELFAMAKKRVSVDKGAHETQFCGLCVVMVPRLCIPIYCLLPLTLFPSLRTHLPSPLMFPLFNHPRIPHSLLPRPSTTLCFFFQKVRFLFDLSSCFPPCTRGRHHSLRCAPIHFQSYLARTLDVFSTCALRYRDRPCIMLLDCS